MKLYKVGEANKVGVPVTVKIPVTAVDPTTLRSAPLSSDINRVSKINPAALAVNTISEVPLVVSVINGSLIVATNPSRISCADSLAVRVTYL